MKYKAPEKYMRKSEAFIKKWKKRYLEVGNVDGECGPLHRRTTTEEDTAIAEEHRKNSNYLLEILAAVS